MLQELGVVLCDDRDLHQSKSESLDRRRGRKRFRLGRDFGRKEDVGNP